MSLPKYLTTVTPLSKYLTIVLFILLPLIGFFLGIRYNQLIQLNQEISKIIPNPLPTPFVNKQINISCNTDDDCQLVDKNYTSDLPSCCLDTSSTNTIAVNKTWYSQVKERYPVKGV